MEAASVLRSQRPAPGHEAVRHETVLRAFQLGDCTIDRATGRVLRPDGVTRVEPRVMDVLLALVDRAGRTVSRDELIDAVWGHPHVSDEALSRCVSLARKALGDDHGKPRFVETVPKRGYRLVQATRAPPATPWIRLAVLPFLNLCGASSHQHFADGLTELVITYAASVAGLDVVSRTSSMRYRDTSMRVADIAHELGADRIVEGSILASKRTLQAVMQLIDPATDTHLLARSYTGDLTDALACQNAIASEMADDIGALLSRS